MAVSNQIRLPKLRSWLQRFDHLLRQPTLLPIVSGLSVAVTILCVGLLLIKAHGPGWPWWFHGVGIALVSGLFAAFLTRRGVNYRDIFDAANDAIFVHDLRTGQILDANRKACEMYGYTPAKLRLCTIQDLSSGDFPYTQEQAAEQVNRAAAGEAILFEWHARNKAGELFWVEVNLRRARLSLSNCDCVLAVVRDIAERKRLEQELWQARKMEAVGQLAGGIAHDFNNLLGVICGYCELLRGDLNGAGNSFGPSLEKIHTASKAAAGLTKQLLAFSRKERLPATTADFNRVILDFSKILPRLLGETIEVVTSPCESSLVVNAAPGEIEQIIMNLSINARDAMPGGGRLLMRTTSVCIDAATAAQRGFSRSGSYVCLSVTDSGVGMDAETIRRAFEPYFSTKEREKGTGLGLAVVYGILRGNGGHIIINSMPGAGTTVDAYWPQVSSAGEEETAVVTTPLCGSETILVVEDFTALREMTCSFLQQQGYTVLGADNGTEALELVRNYSGDIDLLITDVVMPAMSGPALAARVVAMRPTIKVIYTSGYTGELLASHGVPCGDVTLIEKPFTFPFLAQKIREQLDVKRTIVGAEHEDRG
jgi:PAS domain S-box-containing protein